MMAVVAEQSPKSRKADPTEVLGERLFTVGEVALFFSVKQTTVREMIARGDLIAIKLGKEFRISSSALREYKDDREREQRALSEQKRAQKARDNDLRHRQDVDPDAAWEIVQCIACGLTPTFSNWLDRKAGDVVCQGCQNEVAEKGLTKMAWKRKVTLMVNELERQSLKTLYWQDAVEREESLARGEEIRPLWLVYDCGWCGKPTPISRREVLDGRTLPPNCDHEPPFGSGNGVQIEGQGGLSKYDTMILRPLLELEAGEQIRAYGNVNDVDELICRCSYCGERRAVADQTDRLSGQTKCRFCKQSGSCLDVLHQARVIADAWPFVHTIGCACGSLDLVSHETDDHQVVLSWCEKRPDAEKRELVEEWGKKFLSLSADNIKSLCTDVVMRGLPF
jgi:excisionase family DNA binding protein